MTKFFSAGSRILFLTGVAIAICASAVGQNREKFLISAKAGGVNSVNGYVTVLHHSTGRQEVLGSKDDLAAGDIVSTGSDGRVEVLLNPGTYLRASENSEFNFEDTTLEHLRLRLSRGSAIIEATGDDTVALSLTFVTPQTRITVTRHGIYRIDVEQSNRTELKVQKGLAYILGSTQTPVKAGNVAIVSPGAVQIVKADKQKDDLDLWSKQRAEYLAQANRHINGASLASAFSSIAGDPWFDRWFYRTSFLSPSAGLWYWDPFFGFYTFLPPYGTGCSPYGYSYRGWPIGYAWRTAWAGGTPASTPRSPVVADTGRHGKAPGPPKPVSSLVTSRDVAVAGRGWPTRSYGGGNSNFPSSNIGGFPPSAGGYKGTENSIRSTPSSSAPVSAPAPERSMPSVPVSSGGGKKP